MLVSETVREKVLHHTRDELPFSTAVVIDQYDEPTVLAATLKVYARSTSKPSRRCSIRHWPRRVDDQANRHRARKELEATMQCKVYLDLRVKVKADWRDDERVLDDLGLPRKS